FVAVEGPALAMKSVYWIESPTWNGPAVINVLTIETSAEATAVPLLRVLSVLLPRFGSNSFASTDALLSKVPVAVIVAVTVMVVFAPEASEAMMHGRAAQPPPLTFVIDRFVGVSVTWMLVAVEGPALAMKSVYWIESPRWNGPAVISVLTTEMSAEASAVPLLPLLSVLLPVFGS